MSVDKGRRAADAGMFRILAFVHGTSQSAPPIFTCPNGHKNYTSYCLTCQTKGQSADRLQEQRVSIAIAERARRAEGR